MKWYEISIKTTEEAEDAISNILYELGANGVVIEDNEIVSKPNLWDYIDEDQFTKKDYAKVCAYFPESINILELIHTIEQKLKETAKYINIGEGKIAVSDVDEKDWAEEWKKYYKPVEIGDIVIVPSWEDYKAEDSKTIVRLDPGMAFGTGTHESTVLCLEAIQNYVKPGMNVLDVGTGSGILAIAAKKLLAKRVLAVDIDEVAVKVAKENANLNGVEIEIKKNNLVEGIEEKFDIVVANIVADIIIRLSTYVNRVLKDSGIFISSGIIENRLEDVLKSFAKNGLKVVEVKKMGTWCLVVSKKTV